MPGLFLFPKLDAGKQVEAHVVLSGQEAAKSLAPFKTPPYLEYLAGIRVDEIGH